MAVNERDPLTGHETTGHEWDGIKELNTRVPRAIWWAIGITHVWALIIWILMPAWPMINTYTKGLLGVDQRDRVEEEVRALRLSRQDWVEAIEQQGFDEVRNDPRLMDIVYKTGPVLFADNCSGCHGAEAQGGPGYPSLTDLEWLWGDDDETIMETLRVGINAPHPETRVSQMLAFGRDGILTRDEIRTVADYVMSLSGSSEVDPVRLAEGAGIFADNCASCHGEDARGLREMGAPDLTDDSWLYGGDGDAIFHTVHDGRQGWMPAWEDRMSLADRKILTIYLRELASGAQPRSTEQ
jgi:cytochrome c oxidase cbb3-type subunit 3